MGEGTCMARMMGHNMVNPLSMCRQKTPFGAYFPSLPFVINEKCRAYCNAFPTYTQAKAAAVKALKAMGSGRFPRPVNPFTQRFDCKAQVDPKRKCTDFYREAVEAHNARRALTTARPTSASGR